MKQIIAICGFDILDVGVLGFWNNTTGCVLESSFSLPTGPVCIRILIFCTMGATLHYNPHFLYYRTHYVLESWISVLWEPVFIRIIIFSIMGARLY